LERLLTILSETNLTIIQDDAGTLLTDSTPGKNNIIPLLFKIDGSGVRT
jgi:hypothetical protein